MFIVVSIIGFVLLAMGLADKRARHMALLLALLWFETAVIDFGTTVDVAIALRPVVDFVGGIMALAMITRERWSLMVPALFAVMLLSHAAYWIAWHNGVDLWYVYPHALNALWLCQLAAVAWPSGSRVIGLASAYTRSRLSSRRTMAVRRPMGARDGSSDQESL